MYIFLHGHRLLRDIQEEFQSAYPYLKIEFLWKYKAREKSHPLESYQEDLLRLKDIAAIEHQEMICIEEDTTLHEIEQKLTKDFEVFIRFYHYTDSGWIPAGISAATFGELNQQGRISFHQQHNVSANPQHLL
jgi:hypothetical protein